jgi:hypothetical protein
MFGIGFQIGDLLGHFRLGEAAIERAAQVLTAAISPLCQPPMSVSTISVVLRPAFCRPEVP